MKDIGNRSLSRSGVHGLVAKLSLVECMAGVEDPRVDRTKAHDFQDIVVLSVLAVLCSADGWEETELFIKIRFHGSRYSSNFGMAFHPRIPSAESVA